MLKRTRDKQADKQHIPYAPDGGWGWMIVLGSFLIHVITDGIIYSLGIFYIDFLNYFKSSKGETAWVGSLVPAITYSVGPIAGALTNKYGCRKVCILGSLISFTGFILSLFAPNIYCMYVSFGFLGGLGFGFIYLPAIVCVGYYFEKRRSFATGLAVCGAGIGTFIFAPFTKLLLDLYAWKGAVLIDAALILNCILCGAVFRPLTIRETQKSKDVEMNLLNNTQNDHENDCDENSEDGEKNKLAIIAQSDGILHLRNTRQNKKKFQNEVEMHDVHFPDHHFGPLSRKDIFYSGSLLNIQEYQSNPELYISSVMSIPETDSNHGWSLLRCLCISPEIRNVLKQTLDFNLLKDPVFLMFAISNAFTNIGYIIPFMYLPHHATVIGIDKGKAAFLVSIVGITNTVGRIFFGWLSDKQGVNRLMLYNTVLVLCGMGTILCPFCINYPLLVTYSTSFGIFSGVYISLTSVVLVDLLGLEKLTNSFGLILLVQGIATLIGPPIAGWLYDVTGNYNYSFYVAGTGIAFSGAILYFIPCIQYMRRKKKENGDHGGDVSLQVHKMLCQGNDVTVPVTVQNHHDSEPEDSMNNSRTFGRKNDLTSENTE